MLLSSLFGRGRVPCSFGLPLQVLVLAVEELVVEAELGCKTAHVDCVVELVVLGEAS